MGVYAIHLCASASVLRELLHRAVDNQLGSGIRLLGLSTSLGSEA